MNDLASTVSPAALTAAAESPAPAPAQTVAPPAPAAAPIPAPETPAAPVSAPAQAPPAEPSARPTHELQASFLDDEPKDSAQPKDAPHDAAPSDDKASPEKDAAPAPEAAPIVYEFEYPEGFDRGTLDNERMNEFTTLLNSDRVPQERAQKLLDMHVSEVQRASINALDQVWQSYHKTQNEWKSQIRDDREFGGDRLPFTKASANAFIEQYGGSAEDQAQLRRDLFNTGAGNSPALVRAMARAGRALAQEGRPVVAPPPRQAPPNRQQRGLNRYSGTSTPGSF